MIIRKCFVQVVDVKTLSYFLTYFQTSDIRVNCYATYLALVNHNEKKNYHSPCSTVIFYECCSNEKVRNVVTMQPLTCLPVHFGGHLWMHLESLAYIGACAEERRSSDKERHPIGAAVCARTVRHSRFKI